MLLLDFSGSLVSRCSVGFGFLVFGAGGGGGEGGASFCVGLRAALGFGCGFGR